MVEEDRISALPDCLLIEILSRLHYSTEEEFDLEDSAAAAIRTGTLSKRWEHLWTWLPTLVFLYDHDNRPLSDFVWLVDKTLTQRPQLKLNHFQVQIYSYDSQYESQVSNWIRYAVRCNVEELHVNLSSHSLRPKPDLCVDQSFFICSCFTHLRLAGCKLNPVGPISWNNLKSLDISYDKLDDDLIENILSGTPVLETLALNHWYGNLRLNITSRILKNLELSGHHDIIEINAPHILSLTIRNYQRFRKPLLVDVSSLVQANLTLGFYYEHDEEEEEEENLLDFILNLPNVKEELKIGGYQCGKVASRLEAKGFVFPSNVKVVKSSYWV